MLRMHAEQSTIGRGLDHEVRQLRGTNTGCEETIRALQEQTDERSQALTLKSEHAERDAEIIKTLTRKSEYFERHANKHRTNYNNQTAALLDLTVKSEAHARDAARQRSNCSASEDDQEGEQGR